jgi:Concanavalin A-like lectin/glucanases superfamily
VESRLEPDVEYGVVLLRATPARRSTLWLGAWIGASALIGCPQLLEDRFEISPSLPVTGLDSGDHPPLDAPDAGVGSSGPSGAAGAGGAPNTAGTSGSGGAPSAGAGGDSAGPDASPSGAGGTDPGPAPDAGPPPEPLTELGPLLAHRYRFSGSGSVISDSVGTAHGTTVGATLSNGKVSLSGNDQYVDLPNGLISTLESVTVEAWVNWLANPSNSDADWQTIFSFGANAGGEGVQGEGSTYLYLTAKSGDSDEIRAGYTLTGFNNEIFADGDRALPVSSDLTRGTQVVLVVNASQGSLAVYIDGTLEVATTSGQAIELSAIGDVNNWLGRSQFASDPEFAGEILDFRIYGSPLSAAQVGLAFGLGADADL